MSSYTTYAVPCNRQQLPQRTDTHTPTDARSIARGLRTSRVCLCSIHTRTQHTPSPTCAHLDNTTTHNQPRTQNSGFCCCLRVATLVCSAVQGLHCKWEEGASEANGRECRAPNGLTRVPDALPWRIWRIAPYLPKISYICRPRVRLSATPRWMHAAPLPPRRNKCLRNPRDPPSPRNLRA